MGYLKYWVDFVTLLISNISEKEKNVSTIKFQFISGILLSTLCKLHSDWDVGYFETE